MIYPPAFMAAFARLIDANHEGGYSDHPKDPGRATNMGISQKSYPDLDIKALTVEQAQAIYYRDFWSKLPPNLPLDLAPDMLDAAVMSSVGKAVRLLQTTLGVAADGKWGTASQAALDAWAGRYAVLAARFTGACLLFYTELGIWPTFGRGWTRRKAHNLLDLPKG